MAEADTDLRTQAINRRFELDEAIAIMAGKHKAELAPLQEEMTLCERYVQESMNQSGEQGVKTALGHQTYFTTQDSVKVGDWDAAINYIITNKAYHLLNQALNKTSVKEHIEAHKAPPPGAEYSQRKVLAWRRGKA